MKSRFKVVSLLSVFLLLFALGGVASADNAAEIKVAISYPCEQGEECDETGVAVSRAAGAFEADCPSADAVNIYITLHDANGNPATAGPNGEDLDDLEADIESELGTEVNGGNFLAAETTVTFDGDSAARGYVDYRLSQVGTDKVEVTIFGNPTSLSGEALVNVVAPPGELLIVRTCPDAPETLYDEVDPPCNNSDDTEEAGSAVTFTVIATECSDGLFTTAPNLEGQQVTVCAYADYDANGVAGDNDEEKEAVACGDFAMNDGIAQGSLTINHAGPDGLDVLFTATAEDTDDMTVESDQIDDGSEIPFPEWTVDTVEMVPGDPDAIKLAVDTFGNGNHLMDLDVDCLPVLDDNALCGGPGTPKDLFLAICDALGNAVDPDGDVTVTGTLDGVLDAQLSGCETTVIGGYGDTCTLQDTNPTVAGPGVIPGPLTFTAPDLDGTDVSIRLLPADDCGVLDLFVSVGDTAPIDAGDTVELTIESMGVTEVVPAGHDIEITGMSDPSPDGVLLSSDGCATATTTLTKENVMDEDSEADGVQVSLQVCGRATTAPAEEVLFTVKDLDQCGVTASTPGGEGIEDVQPAEPINLAVVDIATGSETASTLDKVNDYAGTTPVVIDTPVVVEEVTAILDEADSCDLQWWDQYTNVVDDEPAYACTSQSGLAFIDLPAPCILTVNYPTGAAGTTDTITCDADFDEDETVDASRSFEVTIVTEITEEEEEEEGTPADALTVECEGPQDVDGNVINPQPGGEAIIRIGDNGDLDVSFVNVTIDFAEGSVPGAELRNLDGSTVTLPVTVSITDGVDRRYVVYSPATGQVIVTATEVSSEGLADASKPVVFGEACAVAIDPANPTVATGTTQQFTASTTCDGVVQSFAAAPVYTYEIVAAGTTADCTGSTIDANGLYTAPDTDTECADKVKVTDSANGNATAEAMVTVIPCAEAPVVTVTPASPACEAQEFCAATTLCDAAVEGTYTWTVTGGTADTTSGDCINVTPSGEGSFTVTATDTANMNAQGSATGDCVGIEVEFTGCGSPLLPWFGIVTIQGTGTSFNLLTGVQYDSLQVIKGIRLVNVAEQTITQFVLLLPSFGPFLPVLLPEYPITVTATVTGLSDTFEIPACGG